MLDRRTVVVAVMIVCLGGLAIAQDEDLPLSNWGAPPYWTPAAAPQAERGIGGSMFVRAQGMRAQAEALPSSPLPFVAIAPCRIVDTRVANPDGFHLPNFADDESRTFDFPVSADCPGLPSTAGAYSLNIQFRPMTQLAYLTAYPTETTMPLVSTIVGNPAGWTTNAAVVPAGTSGQIDIYCQFAGRVVIDVNGYYGPQSVVTSLNTRIGDVTLAEGTNVTITPSGNTLTIAASSGPGGVLPTGTWGQTLYHNGSAWTASSALTNDGTNVGVANNLLLPATSGTAGAIRVAGNRFIHSYGNYNTWVGQNAGNLTLTGYMNTAQGYMSLNSDTTGSGNTASGYASLNANTTGSDNTAIGSTSLTYNTTGHENTALGSTSLTNNTSGQRNTAVGAYCLSRNTIGSYNTASGYYSFWGNYTASRNTAVGYTALYSQSFFNGGIEWNSDNTAIGYQALVANQPTSTSNGFQNTAAGSNALSANTTGAYNTAVGYQSGGTNATINGYTGSSVVLVQNTTGSYNTFVGRGTGSTATVDNCTAVGVDAYCDASNQVRLGNVYVSSIGGKVEWSALSDIRAKRDVRDLDLGLEFLLQLRPVAYTLRNGNGKTDMGFVAQDIEAVLGDGYNVLGIGGDAERTLSLRHTDLIAPLVKAVQEQQTQIEALKAELAARGAEHAQLKALLERVARLETAARLEGSHP